VGGDEPPILHYRTRSGAVASAAPGSARPMPPQSIENTYDNGLLDRLAEPARRYVAGNDLFTGSEVRKRELAPGQVEPNRS
jgi:hypothetical protein